MKIYSKHIVFKEIVNSLYHSIKNNGYKISITDKINPNSNELYILIGVNEFIDIIPKTYIVYQFEQTGVTYQNNSWFTSEYINILKNAMYIWDYSKSNIDYLHKYFNIERKKLIYVPLRYSKILDQFPKNNNKTIDILFIGSINLKRKVLLDKLSLKYNVHIGNNNSWGQERDKLISKSKIVINMQFYENGILELTRISYLLSGGAFIVSECGRESDLEIEMSNYMILCKYNQMEATIDYYLNNETKRIQNHKTFIENWKLTSYDNSIPIECFIECGSEKGINKKKGRIDYYIPKNIKEVDFNISEDGSCILSLPNIDDEDLPYVSIITPTKNRKIFFDLCIYNFYHFIYPTKKLEWIIIDNGNQDLTTILPNDNRIKYIKLSGNHSVGYLRNKCIENSKYEIICYMDDDDVYRPESILARVKSLLKYKKDGIECVGCTQVGCFNILNGQSVLGTNNIMYLSEASMAHTKNFWYKRKYNENDYIGEFKHFLLYRQVEIRSIPYQFIMIALNHHSNTTKNLRNVENYKNWIKTHSNHKSFSFFDMFDENVQNIIMNIKNKI